MIIKEVSIGLGATHNLGDFSSARADVKISADVHDESEIVHVLSRCQSLLIEALRSAHPAFDPGAYDRSSAANIERDNTSADADETAPDADDVSGDLPADAGNVISFASRASSDADDTSADGDVYDQCLAAMKELVARDGNARRVKSILTHYGLTRFTRKVGEEKARGILEAVRAELDA